MAVVGDGRRDLRSLKVVVVTQTTKINRKKNRTFSSQKYKRLQFQIISTNSLTNL